MNEKLGIFLSIILMVCIGLFLIFIAIHSFISNVLLIVSLIFSSIIYAYLIIRIYIIYLDKYRRNRLIKEQDMKIKKIEKEILKNPPLGIKATVMGYRDGVPIYFYFPPKEFILTREVNPKIFKDVHLGKSIKDDLYIDLNKFKKCSKCKRYISIDSRFCVHCGNKL